MIVKELWRYPVKSMGGERLDACQVSEVGLEGDRRWGVMDLPSGRILTARREPKLLFATASITAQGELVIDLPDGRRAGVTDAAVLAAWLERPVSLERAGETGGVYENPRDAELETDWVTWRGPPLAWHDMKRARVSLVSTASIARWDVRRFRPNVLLEGSREDELVGSAIKLGTVTLDVVKKIDRCVMVNRAQPGLEADRDVLRTISRERDTFLAVGALVREAGLASVGDEIQVLRQ